MSVHNESLEMSKPMERVEEAPNLEYRTVSHDSLSMFLAAIGGAILGMLLTLLVLAIINSGTLSFTGGERLSVYEAKLEAVDQNVGTLSGNLDVVAKQITEIRSGMASTETALRNELAAQGDQLTGVNQALDTLNVTRQQFETFTTALSDALTKMNGAAPAAQPANP